VGAHGAAPRSQHAQPALAHANNPNGAAGGQGHGKPQPVKAKATKPHPKPKPEEAKHEPDVAQR
jgi:hypothetical protein